MTGGFLSPLWFLGISRPVLRTVPKAAVARSFGAHLSSAAIGSEYGSRLPLALIGSQIGSLRSLASIGSQSGKRIASPIISAKGMTTPPLIAIAAYGPYYPSYATGNAATGIDWTDPENARGMENGDHAFCYFFTASNSAPLRVGDFGIDIPSGSTLSGILVEVLRSCDATDQVTDYAASGWGARLLLDVEDDDTHVGDDLGDPLTFWPDNFTWASYGGSTNLWGASSLTADDLRSSSFGFDISALATDLDGISAMVKAVRMTVYIVGVQSVLDPASPVFGGSQGAARLTQSPAGGRLT